MKEGVRVREKEIEKEVEKRRRKRNVKIFSKNILFLKISSRKNKIFITVHKNCKHEHSIFPHK